MKSNELKNLGIEVKGVDENSNGTIREFEAYSAALGNVDAHDDRIEPGAFEKTVTERVPARKVKLLDSHNAMSTDAILGVMVEAKEEPVDNPAENGPTHRLWSKFEVSQTDRAQEAVQKVREGIINSMSVGFRALKIEFDVEEESEWMNDPLMAWLFGEAVREIHEVQLFESSLVAFPANEEATTIEDSVKQIATISRLSEKEQYDIQPKHLEYVVKAFDNLKNADIDNNLLNSLNKTVDKLTENINSFKKEDRNILEHLINEYKESQDSPSRNHFFMWLSDQFDEEELSTLDVSDVNKEGEDEDDTEGKDTSDDVSDEDSDKEDNSQSEIAKALETINKNILDGFSQLGELIDKRLPTEDEKEDSDQAVGDTSDEAVEDTDEETSKEEDSEEDSEEDDGAEDELLELELERLKLEQF